MPRGQRKQSDLSSTSVDEKQQDTLTGSTFSSPNPAKDDIKQQANDLGKQLKDKASELGEKVNDAINTTNDNLTNKPVDSEGESLLAKAEHTLEDAGHKVLELAAQAKEFVEHKLEELTDKKEGMDTTAVTEDASSSSSVDTAGAKRKASDLCAQVTEQAVNALHTAEAAAITLKDKALELTGLGGASAEGHLEKGLKDAGDTIDQAGLEARKKARTGSDSLEDKKDELLGNDSLSHTVDKKLDHAGDALKNAKDTLSQAGHELNMKARDATSSS